MTSPTLCWACGNRRFVPGEAVDKKHAHLHYCDCHYHAALVKLRYEVSALRAVDGTVKLDDVLKLITNRMVKYD